MGTQTMRLALALTTLLVGANAGALVFRKVNTSEVGSPELFCPNASAYRTDHVLNHFDGAKTTGLWYEQAYEDPAQVGASCPYFPNNTYDPTTQIIEMSLKVKYGFIPFT